VLLLLATVALGAPRMIPEDSSIDLIGRTAPTFQAKLLDGGDFDLEAHRGQPVVLAFWASWCGPCRQELPALSKLQAERDDIRIFAVNVDREEALARRFLAKVEVDLPIVWDNEATSMGQYNVLSMPTTFLLDAQGTLKFEKVGYSNERGLTALIAAVEALP
jgi:thiol-disulfide isomerase/thioredoxin